MERKRILVLFGGCSTEYGVSLQSAYSVLSRLDPEKYEAIPLGISRRGEWYCYQGPLEGILEDCWLTGPCRRAWISPERGRPRLLLLGEEGLRELPFDIAFPVLHGKNGEDGSIQGLLELAGIPYVGCGVFASAAGMDKDAAHRLAAAAGILVPAAVCLEEPLGEKELAALTEKLRPPLFVKPACAGSSYGITMLEERRGLAEAVSAAFCHDSKVVIEERVPGFEVGCGILGNRQLILGEVDEIELTRGWFDYEEKYHRTTAKIHLPARLPKEERQRIRQAAVQVYRALGCRGYARVDLFYTPAKEIVFNEVNTIPGLTQCSRYPRMLEAAGLDFHRMLEELIRLAEEWASEKSREKAVGGA